MGARHRGDDARRIWAMAGLEVTSRSISSVAVQFVSRVCSRSIDSWAAGILLWPGIRARMGVVGAGERKRVLAFLLVCLSCACC